MVKDSHTNFIGRVNISSLSSTIYGCQIPQGRIYLHDYGHHIYGEDKIDSVCSQFKDGVDNDNMNHTLKFDYFLGIAWGNPENLEKMLDCFGFNFGKEWPGNPDIMNWSIVNGVYVREKVLRAGNMTCGDGLILLGKEEEYRRKCKDLEYFLAHPLPIKGMNGKDILKFDY